MAYTTIDDPSAYFQTKIYTGTGSSNAITNDGNSDLQPDWIWGKARTQTYNHNVFDTSRGLTKRLTADQLDAENTDSTTITAVGSDGFTLGTSANLNGSSVNYVAWQWKANGGTTTTNDASATGVGTIDSAYQINSTSKFSIVTYTGNGSGGASFAHGLGVAPDLVILKNRDTGRSWFVGHHKIGFNFIAGHLNSNDDKDEDSVYWNNTAPSSTVVTLGTNEGGNESGDNFVAYCFTEVQGYSKFGSFTGNGNVDGPFIYTGFKPAFGIFKRTDTTGNWYMMTGKIGDDGQDGNPLEDRLEANTNATEADMGQGYDFLSNGVKVRHNGGEINGSGNSFIYMIWAEHPFVSSKGVPVTAR